MNRPLQVRYKRDRVDRCNICLVKKQLSWDHVPPKGGIDVTRMEVISIFPILTGKRDGWEPIEHQSGNKYRTICKQCNELLGRRYDPSLNKFANEIGRYLKSSLIMPDHISVRNNPMAIARAICGHLLAARLELTESPFDEKLRAFVLDESSTVPDHLHVFYWIYPYTNTIILRDALLTNVMQNSQRHLLLNLLKYFPIAYLLTDDDPFEPIADLINYAEPAGNEEIDISVNLRLVRPAMWPEYSNEGTMLLGGSEMTNSVYGMPRSRK